MELSLAAMLMALAASVNAAAPEWMQVWDAARLTSTNLTALGVAGECALHVDLYLQGLSHDAPWALHMYDSTGRYSSQFLWGNNFRLGSQTQCLEMQEQQFQTAFSVAKIALNISSVRVVTLGLCLPRSCGVQDLKAMLPLTTSASSSLISVRPAPDPSFSFTHYPAFYIVSLAIGCVALLLLSGTILDLFLEKRAATKGKGKGVATPSGDEAGGYRYIPSSDGGECNGNHLAYTAHGPGAAPDKETPKTHRRESLVSRLLLCFSARRNVAKLFEPKGDSPLSCVHGLRVFSLLWVIAGHTCMFSFPFSENRKFRKLVESDFLFQSISNGAFSVDTFFFISGLLIAYLYFKAAGTKEADSITDRCKKFFGIFSYRFIRLSPPYLLVMTLAHLVVLWFRRNSVLEPPTKDDFNCPQFWWRNVLYINTLFPVQSMCMIWSWYLANDMQFYVLAMVLLLASASHLKTAATTLVALLVSSWITTATITLNTQHTPSIEEPLGLFDELYDKPWTRLGPYAVGMAAGFLLYKTNCTIKIHKVVAAVGWTLSLGLSFWLVHGLYGDLSPLASAAYVSLGHTAWALCMAWIIVACTCGYGGFVNDILSSQFLVPLSRLTYCAYLVHPVIMQSVIMHMDSPIHLARSTMIMMIFGYFMASYLLAFVVSMTFEAPFIALLNALHPVKRTQSE